MAMTDICEEKPPRPAREDERGISAARRFTVVAASDFEALLILNAARGVRRGAIYTNSRGEVPDPFCVCQSVEALTRVPAIAGGFGLYQVDAEYAVSPQTGVAKPGGPTRWSVRPSVSSVCVDLDATGKAIFTSSGETPDPPLTALQINEVLHGEFYVSAADELSAYFPFRRFQGKINETPYPKLAAAKGSLFCHPFVTQPADGGWFKITVDLEYRPPKILQGVEYEGWVDVFPDTGTREVINASAAKLSNRWGQIRDGSGQLLTARVPLNPDGTVPTTTSTADNLSQFLGAADWLGSSRLTWHGARLKAVLNYLYADFSQIPFP